MKKELWAKCRSGLSITSYDGEGAVFDLDTRKYYGTNETGAIVLGLLKEKQEGLALSLIKSLLLEEYQISEERELDDDLESFLHDFEQHGLGLLQLGKRGNGDIIVNNSGLNTRRNYMKPKIEEELQAMIVGRQVADLLTDISTTSVAQGVAQGVADVAEAVSED